METKTGNPESTGSDSIPSNLVKFVGADGKVDMAKLSQSYQEAEQKITATTQELAEERRRQAERTAAPAQPTNVVKESGRKITLEDLATDPDAVIRSAVAETAAASGQPMAEAMIAIAHPEVAVLPDGKYKDPEFVKGLQEWAKTLPVETQKSLANRNYSTMEWAVRQYKYMREKASTSTPDQTKPRPNFSESASSASSQVPAGKVYSRSEIRNMYVKEPAKYRALADDIAKAYNEGRVKLDE